MIVSSRPRPAETERSDGLPHLVGEYVVDGSRSRIWFKIRYWLVKQIRGEFTDYSGILRVNPFNPDDSIFEIVISSASINTGNAERDWHLRTGSFLEAERCPKIVFRSQEAVQAGGGTYRLPGNLTIKETTREVTVTLNLIEEAIDSSGFSRVNFHGNFVIDRHFWGLTHDAAVEAEGIHIGNKISVNFEISAIRLA